MNTIEIPPQEWKLVAIHESSHAALIRLLQRFLELSDVSILLEKIPEGYRLGTNSITGNGGGNDSKTAVAIAVLAGVVGQYIYTHGAETVKAKKQEILDDWEILDWQWASRDCELYQQAENGLVGFFPIDPLKFRRYCIGFLIDFISEPNAWAIVEQLSERLLAAQEKKLSRDDLDTFFTSSGYDDWVHSQKAEVNKMLIDMEKVCSRELFPDLGNNSADLFNLNADAKHDMMKKPPES